MVPEPVMVPIVPAAVPVVDAADVSGLRIEATLDGVVKLYFDTGKHAIGTVADAALATLVLELGEGRSVVISGFHDATGDPADAGTDPGCACTTAPHSARGSLLGAFALGALGLFFSRRRSVG